MVQVHAESVRTGLAAIDTVCCFDKVGEEPNDPNIARFSQRIGHGTKKRKVIKPFNVSREERLKWSRKNRLV